MKTIQVAGRKTQGNQGSAPIAGFYGNKDLNQRGIKYGEKFVINAVPTDEKEKRRRKDHLAKGIVSFSNPKDQEAYVEYQHFGSWMTLDLAYQVPTQARKSPEEIAEASGHPVGEPEEDNIPEGKERSGTDTVQKAPFTAETVPNLPKKRNRG